MTSKTIQVQRKIIQEIREIVDYCFNESESIKGFIKCLKNELDYIYDNIRDIIEECLEESETIEELHQCVVDLLDREMFKF